jgi:hypothetical protein
MNERIRELAEQAGLLPKEIGPVVETRHMKKKEQDLEKFAELIVRECVGVCESMQLIGPYKEVQDATLKDAVMQIKQHFGVE